MKDGKRKRKKRQRRVKEWYQHNMKISLEEHNFG